MAFVQFLCVDAEVVTALRQEFGDVPNLGGMHDPNMPDLREVHAALGKDRPQEDEGMGEAADRIDKRPRSEAGSDNPRPRSASRTTREEQQQSTADGK